MLGFRQRPSFKDVLGYIEEGEPVNLPLPNRRASQFVQSHFYLDDLPQSTAPLDENPRPGARIDFVSADEGYQGRPFPQMRRPSFLGPGRRPIARAGPTRLSDATAPTRPGRRQQRRAAASAAGWARLPCEEARPS